MDTRVDGCEHPDWRRHEAHTSPHGQHSAGVVVLLERGAALALCEDDERVKNLIELGEVKPPAPESETLVPDPAYVGLVWHATGSNQDVVVQAAPGVVARMVGNRVAESSRAVDLAESVNRAHNGVGLAVMRKRVLQAADHGHAGDGGIDSQEDVVEDDEGVERARLCDPPRLVPMLAVVPVDVGDGDEVYRGNGQRNLVGERALVDVLADGKRVLEGRLADPWRRNRQWRSIWRELEDGPRRPVTGVYRRACARHGVFVCDGSATRERWDDAPVLIDLPRSSQLAQK
jgi:hypothetical protein